MWLDSTIHHFYTGAMTDTPKRTCAHIKPDGTACLARPQHGSDYCFFHDATTAEKRRESQRQGGIERTRSKAVLPPGSAKVRIRGTADVVKLASQTIQQVQCGQIEVRIANSIAQLAGVVLKAMELTPVLRKEEEKPTACFYVVVRPNRPCPHCKGRKQDPNHGGKCLLCGGTGRANKRNLKTSEPPPPPNIDKPEASDTPTAQPPPNR